MLGALTPVADKVLKYVNNLTPNKLGKKVIFHSQLTRCPEIQADDLVIFSVSEQRLLSKSFLFPNFDSIRMELYGYQNKSFNTRIVDMGDLLQGKTIDDTVVAAKEIVSEILSLGAYPMIIGGFERLMNALSETLKKDSEELVISNVTANIDSDSDEDELEEYSLISSLNALKTEVPRRINYIGVQNFIFNESLFEIPSDIKCDYVRLGELKKDMSVIEPYLRNSTLCGINLYNSVQTSDLAIFDTPNLINGLSAFEICSIAKYSGLSDFMKIFLLYNIPNLKFSSSVAAQILWLYIEGFDDRQTEYPDVDSEHFDLIISDYNGLKIKLLKSRKTQRWWLVFFHKKYIYLPCNASVYSDVLKKNISSDLLKLLR